MLVYCFCALWHAASNPTAEVLWGFGCFFLLFFLSCPPLSPRPSQVSVGALSGCVLPSVLLPEGPQELWSTPATSFCLYLPSKFTVGFVSCSFVPQSAVASESLARVLPFSRHNQIKSFSSELFSAFPLGQASPGRDRTLSHFRWVCFRCMCTLSNFSDPLQIYYNRY